MKKVHILYNPYLDDHYAICEMGHDYFCQESIKNRNLEETLKTLKTLFSARGKKKIEFIIDLSLPKKEKDILKNFIYNNFSKATCTED